MLNTDFIVNEWVPALRGGDYEQGTSTLNWGDGRFCCLGVACDLLVKQGLLPAWQTSLANTTQLGIPDPTRKFGINLDYLPAAAQATIGLGATGTLPYHDVVVVNGESYTSLASANDDGCSFAQIADALEALASKGA